MPLKLEGVAKRAKYSLLPDRKSTENHTICCAKRFIRNNWRDNLMFCVKKLRTPDKQDGRKCVGVI